ncbi:MAG: DUF4114 domain-containing protein [Pseudomonadota bacterium]
MTTNSLKGRLVLSALAAGVSLLAIESAQAQSVVDDTSSPPTTFQAVSPDIVSRVNEALPESRAVGAAFLNPSYDPNLVINQNANIYTTFVDEGAGYKNSLGWFSYTDQVFQSMTQGDIDTDSDGVVSLNEISSVSGVDTGWIFTNSSKQGAGGSLNTGDTVTLGGDSGFVAGTRLGFFLAQDAWNGSDIRATGGTGSERQVFYSLDFLNPENSASAAFDGTDVVDSSRHVAMMYSGDDQSQIILGFEDLNRTDRTANHWNIASDEDFNDAVFILSSNPVEAIQDTQIYTAPAPQLGGMATVGVVALLGGCLFGRKRQNARA